ncbi:MAG: hypothetical protein IKO47_08825 [Ruminococcus sp.]|nr:hypothetical protein [Ruminococcus sp.]
MYRVIVYFEDLQDKSRPYNAGDVYPRKGLRPSAERIEELATDKNIRGIPLIRKEDE